MAEAIIEHKASLGVNHRVFSVQEYIHKQEGDNHAFVIGGEHSQLSMVFLAIGLMETANRFQTWDEWGDYS